MAQSNLTNQITYPACWNDDERMAVLFAPFRTREVNPENYDSKMKFWQDMITHYCIQTGTVVFNKLAVLTAFARGSNVAHGLDTVIEELLRLKIIRLRTEYEYDPQNGWTSWAMNQLVWRPLAWSIFKLKSAIGYEDVKASSGHIDYVHLEVIETYCKDIQSRVLQHNLGKLMHYGELQKLISQEQIKINNESLELCLRTLQCRRCVVLDYKKDVNTLKIHLVKIPSPNDISSTTITEADHAIHNLQMTQINLSKQMEDLEQQITIAAEKVHQLVKDNKRQMAKSHLRKKHLLEKSYEKRSVALHNIEELLNSVTEARSHGEILDAYKIGSRALQTVLKTSGLRYDNVDEVIAEVRETLDSHREVEDAIANTSLVSDNLTSVENDELERELKNLVEEENKLKSNEAVSGTLIPPSTSSESSPLRQVTISDKDLIAMLDQLEVEDNTPNRSQKLAS